MSHESNPNDLSNLDWPLKREGDYDMDGNKYPPEDCVEVKEKAASE